MSAIALTATVAALPWALWALLRGSLMWGCVVFLVAGACFSREFLPIQVGPIPLSLDRIWIVALAAALITQRALGRTERRRWDAPDYLLAALLAWLTWSTFTHDFLKTFQHSGAALWRLASGYWMPAVVYTASSQVRLDERTWKTIMGLLCAFSVYLAITGICEIAGFWSFVFPAYIRNPELGIHFGRARGPFLTAVSFGMYLSVAITCLWALARTARTVSWLLAAPLGALYLAGVYASYTRSAWLGTALAVCVICICTLHRRARAAFLTAVLGACVALCAAKSDALIEVERDITARESRHSTMMRACFAYISWKMFLERPVDGFGFGQFPHAKMSFLYDRNTSLVLEDTRPYVHHSTLLSLLTETGFLGLGLFMAVMAAWTRSAITLLRNPAAPRWQHAHAILFLAALAAYGSQLMFHEVTYKPVDNTLIVLLAGMLSAIVSQQLRAGTGRRPGAFNGTSKRHATRPRAGRVRPTDAYVAHDAGPAIGRPESQEIRQAAAGHC